MHLCGCAIISNEFILTAAHCIVGYEYSRTFYIHSTSSVSPLKIFSLINRQTDNLTSSEIEIRVGTNMWWSGGTVYHAREIIAHEYYDSVDYANDIALIRVQNPIEFNERVKPIKYTANKVPPGSLLQTTGWGAIKYNGQTPDKLQILYTESLSNEECQKRTIE